MSGLADHRAGRKSDGQAIAEMLERSGRYISTPTIVTSGVAVVALVRHHGSQDRHAPSKNLKNTEEGIFDIELRCCSKPFMEDQHDFRHYSVSSDAAR